MTGPRRYGDGSEDRPLFDVPRQGGRPKTRIHAPTVGWAICPACATRTGADQGRALKAAGPHLQWSLHTIVTVLGRARPCAESGRLLCDAPPADGQVRWRLSARQRAAGVPERTVWRCRCGAKA
jgi:hypothetical protein